MWRPELQAECPPGGICVSRAVRDHVQERLGLAFGELGLLNLKNIARPVEAFVLKFDVAETTLKLVEQSLLRGDREGLPLPGKPSIAVLAFTNMSGDLDHEYFSDGIADDIITELSRSRSLFVVARNSSFTYKGRAVDVKQVARELGVRYVLEGSVRRNAGRIRVLAQLIDAETGNHIWAERYDRALEDVFAVQDEITAAVVTAIIPAVADAETKRVLRKLPKSLGAWEACQRGLWHMAKHTPTDTKQAQYFFKRACELDAVLAIPHALLAGCHIQMMGFGEFARGNQEIAEAEAREAIALDPEELSVLATLSAISLYNYADYDAALEYAEHVTVNPNDFFAHLSRGRALAFGGRAADAEEPLLIALRLSPRDPLKSSALNTLAAARYSEATTPRLPSCRNVLFETIRGIRCHISGWLPHWANSIAPMRHAKLCVRRWRFHRRALIFTCDSDSHGSAPKIRNTCSTACARRGWGLTVLALLPICRARITTRDHPI